MSKFEAENDGIFREALTGGCNLFLGAGFSVLAQDGRGRTMPVGSALQEELISHFRVNQYRNLPLPQLCTILERTRADALRAFMLDRFTIKDFDPAYYNLFKLNIKTLITTNVDTLLFSVFDRSEGYYLNDMDLRGPAFKELMAVDCIFLHGCVLVQDRPLHFGTTELASAFRSDPNRWNVLTQQLQQHPTIFIGYALQDSGVLEALSDEASRGRPHKDKWIVVRPPADEATVEYFRALGFQIAIGSTADFLDYVHNSAKSPAKPVGTGGSTHALFPNEAIPAVGTVPVRPVLDFFIGSAPTWSDIYSGRLHRTAYHAKIRDAVTKGQDLLLIGVPASGKSTLMMQIATDLPYDGHKLLCDSLTLGRAQSILKRLAGRSAIVFVDQCSDDAKALLELAAAPNVQVVAADRGYNIEIAWHLLAGHSFNVIDITELNDLDSQAIFASIPIEARTNSLSGRESEAGWSMFELLDHNLRVPSLRQRYAGVIRQLAHRDESLLDLLLISCYVHSCRTPVSMDMLLAFFRDLPDGFKGIYALRDSLGALLADASGSLVDDTQDYYIPRSVALSESVIQETPPALLSHFLIKFHQRLSPARIHRYDVFKRKAYEHALLAKAFPQVEDGLRFYQSIYDRDRDAFVLQHGALYLAKNRRYQEAFRWIDDALAAVGGRSFTIRNSHASIIFRANKDKNPSDPLVIDGFRRSMDILAECYESDRRKAYHATVFADQALDLTRLYKEDWVQPYLTTALDWLKDERKRYPWHREVKRLVSVVESRLHSLGMH